MSIFDECFSRWRSGVLGLAGPAVAWRAACFVFFRPPPARQRRGPHAAILARRFSLENSGAPGGAWFGPWGRPSMSSIHGKIAPAAKTCITNRHAKSASTVNHSVS